MALRTEILSEEEIELRGLSQNEYYENQDMEILLSVPSDEELKSRGLSKEEYIKESREDLAIRNMLKNLNLDMDKYKTERLLLQVIEYMKVFDLPMNADGYLEYYNIAQDVKNMEEYFEEECEVSKYPMICMDGKVAQYSKFLKALIECNTYLEEKFEKFDTKRKYTEDELFEIESNPWWE